MSKSTGTAESHEEGDENMLLDDGFSVVDDINAAKGAKAEKVEQKKESPEKVEKESKKDDAKVSNAQEVKKEPKDEAPIKEEPLKDSESEKKSENTLIISNDEDLIADEKSVKTEKDSSDVDSQNAKSDSGKGNVRKKSAETSFVWVSNISKFVKASGLKKHFSECGKVNTAKVVTNGKVFFGYVEFESVENAVECVKKMNNSVLNGKKILVSRTRPDVTKKSAGKRAHKSDPTDVKKEVKESKTVEEEKGNDDSSKAKEKVAKQNGAEDKKQKVEKKVGEKRPKSVSDVPTNDKVVEDLKRKMNDFRRRAERSREDFERAQIESGNLRRRLQNEQKRCRAEEMRVEKYRLEIRGLKDQLKQARMDLDKETSRMMKKHKIDLEKLEYQRDNYMKQKEEYKRRLEEQERKLEEARKAMDHSKRYRKSRSMSPPPKRFRGREQAFSEHSPPPPPKLSSEVRPKPSQDHQSSYYEGKKPRAIYDRLGDYGGKTFSKDTNGRHRSSYPGDIVLSKPWSQPNPESWKKPNSSTTFLKPYMERYDAPMAGYQVPSNSYYPPGTSDYNVAKHGHFENARKY